MNILFVVILYFGNLLLLVVFEVILWSILKISFKKHIDALDIIEMFIKGKKIIFYHRKVGSQSFKLTVRLEKV